MQFISTNGQTSPVNFQTTLMQGQAPDKGLFYPQHIPTLTDAQLQKFVEMDYSEIAYTILKQFSGEEIEDAVLKTMCKEAYNFEIPLEQVNENTYILRLDQGPTAAFKDFAARIMARMLNYFVSKNNQKLNILVATSGDTGSAVANAFHGLDNLSITVLFPIDEVTLRQRKLMTTLGNNIRCIAINGKFDDCQSLVKRAFLDNELQTLSLSSANSINIGRLIPQSVYYVYTWSRLIKNSRQKLVFSIPSGNFGNLMGGLIADKMGISVNKFIAATNQNDAFTRFYQTGDYKPISPSVNSISNAMNVGAPNNTPRIARLFDGAINELGQILHTPDMEKLKTKMYADSFTDEQTVDCIQRVYKNYNTVLEPHGAVGWLGLESYLAQQREQNNTNANQINVVLETAHPAKFPEVVEKVLGIDIALPQAMANSESKTEHFTRMENSYEQFKQFLFKTL